MRNSAGSKGGKVVVIRRSNSGGGIKTFTLAFAAFLTVFGVGMAVTNLPLEAGTGQEDTAANYTLSFEICGRIRHTCVVDGDTIWLQGEKIRIADIDTPEIGRPQCDYEYGLGIRARDRLRELIDNRSFGLRSIGGRDEDQYGRKLRVIVQDGRSVGDVLVEEGLARTWSGRREPWC